MMDDKIKTKGRDLWALNGRYSIASDTTADEMLNDVGCLLESVDAVVEAVIMGLEEEDGDMIANAQRVVPQMLYGVRYQLEMVRNLAAAAHVAVNGA